MYTQTWNKYLPVIRILLKRAITEDQSLQLNTSDFQKAPTVRKIAQKFTIGFSNGKADSTIGLPDIAKDLSSVLLFDTATKELLSQNEYTIDFNTKCQLILRRVAGVSNETTIAPFSKAHCGDFSLG